MGPFLPSVTIYRDLGTTESGGQILGSRHLSHSLPQIWMDSRRGGVLIQRRGASGPLSLTLISSIIYPDFFFFLAAPTAWGGSQARDGNHATAGTRAYVVTMLDPYLLDHQGTPTLNSHYHTRLVLFPGKMCCSQVYLLLKETENIPSVLP